MTKDILEQAQEMVGRIIRSAREPVSRQFILKVKGNRRFLIAFEMDLRKFVRRWARNQEPRSVGVFRKPKTKKND